MTVYVRFIEQGTCNVDSWGEILDIGSGVSESVFLYCFGGTGRYGLAHRVASDVIVLAVAAPVLGDTVELRGVLYADGSVALGQTINSGAEVLTAPSAALALSPAWAAPTLYLGGPTLGANDFQAALVAGGLRTLAEMRSAF